MTVVIVGATASGKSSLALALAELCVADGQPAEIVNADSMLVYRGMDIGTAKPTLEERQRVRHHLVDVLEVTQTATVAEFQSMARAAIADCRVRGVLPIVVGGSALYVRAVVDRFTFPGTDPTVRAGLEAEVERIGSPALYERLSCLDPAAAAAVHPENARRIVRALEVIALTGGPYPSSLPVREYELADVVQIGLDIDRPTLDARIAHRVAQMWNAGLVNEVNQLVQRGIRGGVTASRALGYRQVLSMLDGEIDDAEARRQTIAGTRRFARRQDSWFRKDQRISWLRFHDDDLAARARRVVALLQNPADQPPR